MNGRETGAAPSLNQAPKGHTEGESEVIIESDEENESYFHWEPVLSPNKKQNGIAFLFYPWGSKSEEEQGIRIWGSFFFNCSVSNNFKALGSTDIRVYTSSFPHPHTTSKRATFYAEMLP